MAVGLEVFSVDEHAAHLLFGYAAHANRFCDGAQAAVRGPMRRLINRYNKETAEKLLSEVVALAPGRDCAGVLRNARLRPAFCPAYSMAHHLQRAGASSATNVEESLHERVYKLAGRRQPLMVAMTGAKLVDMKDIEDVDNSRGAGARTSVGCGVLSQQRRESRLRTRARGGGVESAVDEDSVADGDAATAAPKKVARRATRKTKPKAATGAPAPTPGLSIGGSAIALIWLLQGNSGATQCGALHESQPTTWNGRSEIWRHNCSRGVPRPTAKTTRIKLTRPSPRLVSHCNDVI